MEPTHTIGARSTADSMAEGRMKVDVGGKKQKMKNKKKKILKEEIKKYY